MIDGVYQGTAYNDTCVAEIALLTAILSDEDFYNNILRNLGVPNIAPTMWYTNPLELGSVPDPDGIRLLEYMSFEYNDDYKTKIAFLDNGLVQQPGWLSANLRLAYKSRRFGRFLAEIHQICRFSAEVVQ
jgi:hypothetical protein